MWGRSMIVRNYFLKLHFDQRAKTAPYPAQG